MLVVILVVLESFMGVLGLSRYLGLSIYKGSDGWIVHLIKGCA